MVQIYTLLLSGSIPPTRIISFKQFCKGRKVTIKDYLLEMLPNYPKGLSCRDISNLSGIYVQSLTHPIKELLQQKKLEIVGFGKQEETNRIVQLYGIYQSENTNHV